MSDLLANDPNMPDRHQSRGNGGGHCPDHWAGRYCAPCSAAEGRAIGGPCPGAVAVWRKRAEEVMARASNDTVDSLS